MPRKKTVQHVMEQKLEESKNDTMATPAEVKSDEAAQQPKPLTLEDRLKDRLTRLEQESAANFNQIEMAFQQLAPLIQLSRQIEEQQKIAQEHPELAQQGGKGALAGIMQLIPYFTQALGGGGGSNPLGEELTKKVLDAGLQQMFAGTELLKAMQTRMLADIGAKQIKKTFSDE